MRGYWQEKKAQREQEAKRKRELLAAQFHREVAAGSREMGENMITRRNYYGNTDTVPYEAIMHIEGRSTQSA